jgi:hypothetical protein
LFTVVDDQTLGLGEGCEKIWWQKPTPTEQREDKALRIDLVVVVVVVVAAEMG